MLHHRHIFRPFVRSRFADKNEIPLPFLLYLFTNSLVHNHLFISFHLLTWNIELFYVKTCCSVNIQVILKRNLPTNAVIFWRVWLATHKYFNLHTNIFWEIRIGLRTGKRNRKIVGYRMYENRLYKFQYFHFPFYIIWK